MTLPYEESEELADFRRQIDLLRDVGFAYEVARHALAGSGHPLTSQGGAAYRQLLERLTREVFDLARRYAETQTECIPLPLQIQILCTVMAIEKKDRESEPPP